MKIKVLPLIATAGILFLAGMTYGRPATKHRPNTPSERINNSLGIENSEGNLEKEDYTFEDMFGLIDGGNQTDAISRKVKTHRPYLIDWKAPDATQSLTVDFNAMTVMFDQKRVDFPAWSHTFEASKTTNVWVADDGSISYEACDPERYTTLTRYPDRMMVVQVVAGPTKVVGVYFRGDTGRTSLPHTKHPINKEEIFVNYYVKPHNLDWSASAVEYGDVIRTVDGNLYYCIRGGILDAEKPPVPSYSYELNTGFYRQTSGTAAIVYIGRDTYEGAFRSAYMAGINWYFANLGVGWLAKSDSVIADDLADEMLNHIRTAIDRAIRPWRASTQYRYGMLVTDTDGYIWQCRNDGTSGKSASWPQSPAAGATDCIDNDIAWRCFGQTSPSATWQLGDTNVTMDEFKAPDSHDAYASTLMWALEQLRIAGYVPDSFFMETSAHGISYVAAMREIIHYNLLTQITNGLCKTFQGDIVPDGSGRSYNLQFLMDNCEVWAGLQAAHDFYSDERYTADATYPAYIGSFKKIILAGINTLWEDDARMFAYYQGYDPAKTPDVPLFYPWVMSQAWLSLFSVPVDYFKTRSCFDFMASEYSDWWQINNIDNLAALGAHVGLYRFNPTAKIRTQILNRVETEKMEASDSELYFMDLGYYHYLRSVKEN